MLNKCYKCNSENSIACLKCLTPLKYLMVEHMVRKEIAKKAGGTKSESKRLAAQRNGKKGGRPRAKKHNGV